jgi:hypothetical protein
VASTTRCQCTIPLEEYLDAYIEAAGIGGQPKSCLFRASNGKTGILSERPFDRKDAFAMVQRRAMAAGIRTKIGCQQTDFQPSRRQTRSRCAGPLQIRAVGAH